MSPLARDSSPRYTQSWGGGGRFVGEDISPCGNGGLTYDRPHARGRGRRPYSGVERTPIPTSAIFSFSDSIDLVHPDADQDVECYMYLLRAGFEAAR